MSQHSLDFKHHDVEMFFAKRLADHGVRIFEGLTDPATRKERIRAAILEARLDCTIIGRAPSGKPETYSQSFGRFYGEPLVPSQRKGK